LKSILVTLGIDILMLLLFLTIFYLRKTYCEKDKDASNAAARAAQIRKAEELRGPVDGA